MVRKFPPFRSERKKRSTSEGTPQFPNGISGKLPYHLTSNRNFRIFWPNGKHPCYPRPENDLGRKITETWVTRNKLASSRRSASWRIARKTASEKIGEKCFLSSHFAHIFSLAVFRAEPQLSNFLPEKILNKMLRPYARQPGKVLNGLSWTNKCPAESI